jgi:hypothetical protein
MSSGPRSPLSRICTIEPNRNVTVASASQISDQNRDAEKRLPKE